eukprot:68685-Prymnesium_polylepis.1
MCIRDSINGVGSSGSRAIALIATSACPSRTVVKSADAAAGGTAPAAISWKKPPPLVCTPRAGTTPANATARAAARQRA